ncbi:MAG: SDR family oxidoreductase [Pseudomonadota bacterium]
MNAPQKRVALVTGASEGIGRALVATLVRRGDYDAIAITARSRDRLDSLADELAAHGVSILVLPADLTDEQAGRDVVAQTLAAFGRLDALFNNAGATMWAPFREITDLSVFRRVMDINYFAVLNLTHAALPALIESRGRLVGVSSVAGLTGVPTRSGYCASKHALNGLYDSLRVELEGTGVSVTIVAPDFVVSEIHRRALTGDGSALSKSPMQESRIMTAEQCAERIATAAARRQRLHITSLRGRAGRWLKLIAPGLIDRIAAKAISKGR